MAFESQATPLGLTFLPVHRTNQMLSLALWLSGLSLDVSWWTGHVQMSGAGSLLGCEAGPTDPHGPSVAPRHTVSCMPRPHQHRGASMLAPPQGSGWRGLGRPEPAYSAQDSGLGSSGPACPPGLWKPLLGVTGSHRSEVSVSRPLLCTDRLPRSVPGASWQRWSKRDAWTDRPQGRCCSPPPGARSSVSVTTASARAYVTDTVVMTRDDSDICSRPGVGPWGLEGSLWISSSGTLTQRQGLVG